jgi:hypothetical protein
VIGVISKTNRQEELKQASTHMLRCYLWREGGAKTKAFVRTGSRRQPWMMQQIAAFRQVSAANAESCRARAPLVYSELRRVARRNA